MSNKKIICFTPKCNDVLVQIVDTITFKEDLQIFSFAKLEDLLPELPKLPLNNVKAVLFRFTANDTEEKGKLAKLLETYYAKHRIQVLGCSWNSIFVSSLLLACVAEHGEKAFPDIKFGLIVCEDDKVMYIHAISSKGLPASHFGVYIHILSTSCVPLNRLSKDLIGEVQATDVYITCQQELGMIPITNKQKQVLKTVASILKSKNVTIITKNMHEFCGKAYALKVSKLLGESQTKYDVVSNGYANYGIATLEEGRKMTKFNIQQLRECLVKAAALESIPFYEMVVCYEKFQNLVFLKSANNMNDSPKILEKFSVTELGTSLILSVDKFYITRMFVHKDNKQIKNGVIISFKDETFSVETIKDGKLNDINFNDIPIAISFVDNNVQVGSAAVKVRDDRNSYVVTDVLKFMVADLSKLKTDSKWGFKIVKDKDGKLLLEFDTFRGRRKSAPSFLFSLLLKWAVKQAEENLGTMPNKIVIVTKLLDEVMKQHLRASCESAKLNPKEVQFQKYKIVEVDVEVE